MYIKHAFFVLLMALMVLFCSACATKKQDVLGLPPVDASNHYRQTHVFNTGDRGRVLSAAVTTLQELGYNITVAESQLGLVTASKTINNTNAFDTALATLGAILREETTARKQTQEITISIVVLPSQTGENTRIRTAFQRTTRDTQGTISKNETLTDPELYRSFYQRVSKSHFLQAHYL